jgi:hypothetical protein
MSVICDLQLIAFGRWFFSLSIRRPASRTKKTEGGQPPFPDFVGPLRFRPLALTLRPVRDRESPVHSGEDTRAVRTINKVLAIVPAEDTV